MDADVTPEKAAMMRTRDRAQGLHRRVIVPMLFQVGHTVVGLDSDLYQECAFSIGTLEVPDIGIALPS